MTQPMYHNNSCVRADSFEHGICKFSLKMVWETSKHVGEVRYRYVINRECAFSWCNWRDV